MKPLNEEYVVISLLFWEIFRDIIVHTILYPHYPIYTVYRLYDPGAVTYASVACGSIYDQDQNGIKRSLFF